LPTFAVVCADQRTGAQFIRDVEATDEDDARAQLSGEGLLTGAVHHRASAAAPAAPPPNPYARLEDELAQIRQLLSGRAFFKKLQRNIARGVAVGAFMCLLLVLVLYFTITVVIEAVEMYASRGY
jgi:hypothetical protein